MFRVISIVCWLGALLSLSGGARAGDARVYRKFCLELDYANRIFAEGAGGKKRLRECLFSKARPAGRCAGLLGVGRGVIRYVRKNRGSFRISGDALSGFVLQVTDRRLKEIGKNGRYAGLIRLRLQIQELVHHLGSHTKTAGAAQATPDNLVKVQRRYLDLLDEQLEKENDRRIQKCLMRELDRYSKLVPRTK